METTTHEYSPVNLMGLTEEAEFEILTEDDDEEYDDDEDDDDDEDMADFTDNGKGEKVRKPQKVEIIINDKNEDGSLKRFSDSVDDVGGQAFTSVSYMARLYGGSGGNIGEEEIQSAVEAAKKAIISYGDIPIVKDMRVKESLTEWFGG